MLPKEVYDETTRLFLFLVATELCSFSFSSGLWDTVENVIAIFNAVMIININ